MTPTEQQIAVAKACGWREAFPSNGPAHPGTRKGGIMLPYTWINEVDGRRAQNLPDYLNDLNAMHEAWETAIFDERDDTKHTAFRSHLQRICLKDCQLASTRYNSVCNATAAQRAEAFLRTLNLWTTST
jgi:hypothetical protein